MESGKIDIDSEVKGPKEPVATYKSIPDDDSVLAYKESAKEEEAKMVKQNGDTDIDDGAEERMLKDTGKINSNKDATEVKFISENGDAKIDIETVKQTLTGMGKEELMKFANDPFWKRLRWFMFIAFWLLWLAMLAGAIAIVIMAPKCPAPEPKKVWEKSPIIHLDPTATPGGLKGLVSILDNLKDKHIQAISIGPIVKMSKDGSTVDFKDVHPELGNMEDFKELVKAAEAHEQEIILELDPNHTSMDHYWFNQSVQRIEPYTDYYVWANGKNENEGTYPTNWLSVYGGSAWEWNDVREQYYLHQFNKTQPDLNYANPAVVQELSNIFIHWMKLGVTGFRLANTQYLMEDLPHNEGRSYSPASEQSYESLNHVYTYDLVNNSQVLKQWREVVHNHTNSNGLFALQGDISNGTLAVYNNKTTKLIDLPQRSRFLYEANSNISASAIQAGVNNSLSLDSTWPAWNLNGPQMSLNQRLPAEVAESLTLMTLLLPGTSILTLNQTQHPGDAFKTLTEIRNKPAFCYGDTKTNIVNGTVFVYTRLKSGNPGYLVAYQSGDTAATVDLSVIDKVSEEVKIVALSSNYVWENVAVTNTIYSNQIQISPKSTLVVEFTPK